MNMSARVAVIGASVAGTACARLLTDAGHSVRLFDKPGGIGGRMATRSVEWLADGGIVHHSPFVHGAPGFTARSPDFVRFVEQAVRDGLLARWVPVVAPGSHTSLDVATLWVPVPDKSSLCRGMLSDVSISRACSVAALRRDNDGWSVESPGPAVAQGFSHVVLAVPPQQAAPLLQPHRPDWAQRATVLPMAPSWTLMGVTTDTELAAPTWDLAWPTHGPLAWVVRNDAKPGRHCVPGLAHWVVHATTPWSQTYLETPVAEVQAMLQQALAQLLGRPLTWHHTAVHHWRYASVPRADASAAATGNCWWNASLSLGLCGDALGGAGVEGAWTFGRALATSVIDRYRAAPAVAGLPAARAC